jgi:hypothetical protein
MSSFEEDYEKQRLLLPQVIDLCGTYLARHIFKEAPLDDDWERNTDLMVLTDNQVRIACRLRSHKYLTIKNYANEFTIRTVRFSRAKTELRKIIEGWGTHNFYGFRSEDGSTIDAWMIGDLTIFRGWHADELLQGRMPGIEHSNGGPHPSKFRAYTIDDLPSRFVIARHRTAIDNRDDEFEEAF